jgi:hypothetical protein
LTTYIPLLDVDTTLGILCALSFARYSLTTGRLYVVANWQGMTTPFLIIMPTWLTAHISQNTYAYLYK